MREILFRGKTDKGEWVQGIPFFEEERCYIIEDLFICDEYDCTGTVNSMVIPSTVGQYTGLTDKNGKKIFEGDIVNFKTTAHYFKNCRIKYQSCYGRYCAIDNHGYEYPIDKTFEYEVIGNIYDNPELLERSENNA